MRMASRILQYRKILLILILIAILQSTHTLNDDIQKNGQTEDKKEALSSQTAIPVDPGGKGEEEKSVPVVEENPKKELDKKIDEEPQKETEQETRSVKQEVIKKTTEKVESATQTTTSSSTTTTTQNEQHTSSSEKSESTTETVKTEKDESKEKSVKGNVEEPQAVKLTEQPEDQKQPKEPTGSSLGSNTATVPPTGSASETQEQTKSASETVERHLEPSNATLSLLDSDSDKVTEQNSDGKVESKQELGQENKTETSGKEKKEEKKDEDFETYTEWRQKALAEEEQKNKQTETSGSSMPASKKQNRKNNFASKECGSKILGSNPESENAKAVLTANKDEYMINPCKVKKWFIVELCEPIHVRSIEVASLELFSSQPKTLRVSVSDRYPTKDWQIVGEFQATEDRTLQNFEIKSEEDFFVKYVKVEMLDHYGEEHFCPLTLFKVFGIPVELDGLMNQQEDDDDSDNDMDTALLNNGEEGSDSTEPKNLFATAKDTVMKLVKKVLNVEEKAEVKDAAANGTSLSKNVTQENTTVVNGTRYMLPCTPEIILPSASLKEPPVSTSAAADWSVNPLEPLISFNGIGLSRAHEIPDVEGENIKPKAEDPTIIVTKLEDHEQIPSQDLKHDKYLADTSGKLCHISQPSRKNKTSALCLYLIMMTRGRESSKFVPNGQGSVVKEKKTSSTEERKTMVSSAEISHEESESSVKGKASEETVNMSEPTSLLVSSSSSDTIEVSQTSQNPLESESLMKTADEPSTSEIKVSEVVFSVTSTETQIQLEPSMKSEVDVSPEKSSGSVHSESVSTQSSVDAGNTNNVPETQKTEELVASTLTTPVLQETGTGINEKTVTGSIESLTSSGDSQSHVSKQVLSEEIISSGIPTATVAEAITTVNDNNPSTPSVDIEQSSTQNVEEEIQSKPVADTRTSNDTIVPKRSSPKDLVRVPIMPMQKSSTAIMRLANRIKILESNVTLSSRFLDEMTQKFKKQSEEMLRLLNTKFDNVTRAADKRDQEQQEQINALEHRLENLTDLVFTLQQNMDTLSKQLTDRQMVMTSVEVFILVIIFVVCMRRGKTSSTTLPPEVQQLLRNMPVSPDLSNNIRRNSCSDVLSRKKPIENVGTSLQKYSSDTVLDHKTSREFDPGGSRSCSLQMHQKEISRKKKKKKNKFHDNLTLSSSRNESDVIETECNSAGLLFGTSSEVSQESKESIKRSRSYGGFWSLFSDGKNETSNVKSSCSVVNKKQHDTLKNTNSSALLKQNSGVHVEKLDGSTGNYVSNGATASQRKSFNVVGKLTHRNVHRPPVDGKLPVKSGMNGQCTRDETDKIIPTWGSTKPQTFPREGSVQKCDKKISNLTERNIPKKIFHKRASSADFSPKKKSSSTWVNMFGWN